MAPNSGKIFPDPRADVYGIDLRLGVVRVTLRMKGHGYFQSAFSFSLL